MTAVAHLPVDQADRDAIRTDLDATLLVDAGAGTGKTSELVERITGLLRTGRAEIRSLAAITFTEAAAAELRHRVRDRLETLAATEGDPAGRIGAALAGMDDAAFTTLHAFAQRLLAEHPLEAGLPPRVEILPEAEEHAAFERRWDRFLGELLDDPAAAGLVRRASDLGFRVGALREVAQGLSDDLERVGLLAAGQDLPVPDTARLRAALADALALRARCTDAADGLAAHLDGPVSVLAQGLAAPGDADDVVRLLVDAPSPTSSRGNQASWNGDKPQVAAALRRAEAERAALVGAQCDAVSRALGSRLAGFVTAWGEERRQEGRLRFHDLLVGARGLLAGSADVRAGLRRRWTHLLIDEFQDTDPLQIELAVLLASGDPDAARDWAAAALDPGRLFVVGDPTQSIYRFRRADVAVYDRARRHLPVQARSLTQNFRCVPGVVDWVNAVFTALIGPGVPGGQPPYRPLTAQRDPVGDAPAVRRFGGPSDGSSAEVRVQEADDVAAVVGRVLAERWPVLDRRTGEVRAARRADIAVLVRRHRTVRLLERALEDAGLPYRIESRSLIWATDEVRDLVTILQAVEDPADEVAVVAALRHPAFACDDRALLDWRARGGGWRRRGRTPTVYPTTIPWRSRSRACARCTRAPPLLRRRTGRAPRRRPAPGRAGVRPPPAARPLAAAALPGRPGPRLPRRRRGPARVPALGGAAGGARRARGRVRRGRARRRRGPHHHHPRRQGAGVSDRGAAGPRRRPQAAAGPAPGAVGRASRGRAQPRRGAEDRGVRPRQEARGRAARARGGAAAVRRRDPRPRPPRGVAAPPRRDRLPRPRAAGPGGPGRRLGRDRPGPRPGADPVPVPASAPDPAEDAAPAELAAWRAGRAAQRRAAPARVLAATAIAEALAPPPAHPPGPRPATPAATAELPTTAGPGGAPRPGGRGARDRRARRRSRGRGRGGSRDRRASCRRPGRRRSGRGRRGRRDGAGPGGARRAGDRGPRPAGGRRGARARLAAAEGMPDRADVVAAMARSALAAPAVRRRGPAALAQVHVGTPLEGAVVEGYIDLLAEEDGDLVVVDYKTDALAGRTAEAATARYRAQAATYALALEATTGRTVRRCVFVLTSLPAAVEVVLKGDALAPSVGGSVPTCAPPYPRLAWRADAHDRPLPRDHVARRPRLTFRRVPRLAAAVPADRAAEVVGGSRDHPPAPGSAEALRALRSHPPVRGPPAALPDLPAAAVPAPLPRRGAPGAPAARGRPRHSREHHHPAPAATPAAPSRPPPDTAARRRDPSHAQHRPFLSTPLVRAWRTNASR